MRHADEAKNLTCQACSLQLSETIKFIDAQKMGRHGTDFIVHQYLFRKPRNPIGAGIGIEIGIEINMHDFSFLRNPVSIMQLGCLA